jgi:hypothetical protein
MSMSDHILSLCTKVEELHVELDAEVNALTMAFTMWSEALMVEAAAIRAGRKALIADRAALYAERAAMNNT